MYQTVYSMNTMHLKETIYIITVPVFYTLFFLNKTYRYYFALVYTVQYSTA